MKNKYFFIKVPGIVSLIMIIILYFLWYFIPSLKSINQYKRRLKDMNLKIVDFVRAESDFSFSNAQERSFFEQANRELSQKIPEVKTGEDFIALFTKVSAYIQKLARRDGIFKLELNSDPKELGVNAPGTGNGLPTLVKNLKFQAITLSFTGELKNAVNFINHIPWSKYYLSEDKIVVSGGDFFPSYIVYLKIYYIDLRRKPEQQPVNRDATSQLVDRPAVSTSIAVPPTESGPGRTGAGFNGPIIDYNSEVLLKRIDPGWAAPHPQKELYGRYKNI